MNNEAMFKLTYGLFVVCSSENNQQYGCIVNTPTQVTSSPNRIAVTINKDNYTHDIVLNSKQLNISILDESVPFDIIKRFGFQSGRDTYKFEGFGDYKIAENNIAYLTKYTNAYIGGKVISTMDLGTHTMFIVDVSLGEVLSHNESVTYSYYFKHIKPNNQVKKTGWICKICGFIYEGDPLPEDFICPICKHGASDFEKIK